MTSKGMSGLREGRRKVAESKTEPEIIKNSRKLVEWKQKMAQVPSPSVLGNVDVTGVILAVVDADQFSITKGSNAAGVLP